MKTYTKCMGKLESQHAREPQKPLTTVFLYKQHKSQLTPNRWANLSHFEHSKLEIPRIYSEQQWVTVQIDRIPRMPWTKASTSNLPRYQSSEMTPASRNQEREPVFRGTDYKVYSLSLYPSLYAYVLQTSPHRVIRVKILACTWRFHFVCLLNQLIMITYMLHSMAFR